MKTLLGISRQIDAFTDRLGRAAIWLVLIVTLISAANALVRYGINWSSNGLLEIQWYLFSAIFMLCSGYTFLKNEHVRIDIVSGHLLPRTRAWIDIFGIVFFLMPMCYLLVTLGWPFFVATWKTGEVSANAGGLIRWPVKLLVPAGFLLLWVQGVSELIKRIAFIRGLIPDPNERGKTSEEALVDDLARSAREAGRDD